MLYEYKIVFTKENLDEVAIPYLQESSCAFVRPLDRAVNDNSVDALMRCYQ